MIASGVIILGCIFVVSLLIYLIQQMIQFTNERNSSSRNDGEINEVQFSDGENPRGENDTQEFQLSASDMQQIINQVLKTLKEKERDQEINDSTISQV